MPDNPSNDRPLALGDLAQAESPELVRVALGRFRRRLLVRSIVVLLIIGSAVVLYPRYFSTPADLVQQIREGRGELVFREVDGGGVKATVFRAARLSKETYAQRQSFGLDLAVTGLSLKPGEHLVVGLVRDGRSVLEVRTGMSENIAGLEIWLALAAGTQTVDIPMAAVVRDGAGFSLAHASLGTLHLDMQQLKVPDWIWR